ncbi:hypothetical protein CFE70_004008 [Pyrenophora teres f. teres 0-1]|uniref:Uncharacterized protein n=2 Tax=Pyrenophora teres f. teres TaxID=97479 RepID=E3RJA1_PYRTT|nr:hypothetical protein PTT_08198 [Pyrenophora teres f. teres 0-1]KAE8845522.1 hypothetical protein HRS9139_00089 [Pyrenophora teres f. teres]KAE8847660.1 hypothetical protein PTNB85_01503 [Pyrenophora teres f. teres]KAE8854183.1 hypothetical protein HRS9122_01175 [Pyrenophora teres f. teres]KAE8867588.1 hypothetical protein PTNB29_01499 [Pyrenophora teres f. teres]
MVSFSALALLAASAIAGPIARQATIPECWDWEVVGWEAGCSRRGCYYGFDLIIPDAEGGTGSARAKCNGYEQGYDNGFTIPSTFELCKLIQGSNVQVAARLSLRVKNNTASVDQTFQVSVLNPPYNGRLGYNYTATHVARFNQFVTPPLNFTVTPTEVFATNDTSLSSRRGPIV